MLLEVATTAIEKLIEELRNAEPVKRDKFLKTALSLVEFSSETLKNKG
ncbi:hypothetical protein BR63_04315 [Thermanaerosceptrum fracticalcis]|uniref:Uncharacterized protein n=1 Tax=Thermanaerosceptrum fracticalcis TaxID=1712410 RepID=A0A7G6E0K5_THEFR|nr:hypothetical protein [Thermanaerosceptrum fracticalcis]QNB45609.1 hypothetical protein BR63_04315 [Thermanaerosceptrum fracticalcis]